MDTFENTGTSQPAQALSLPEEDTPLQVTAQEAAEEDAPKESEKPRSPYENSPYESFYDTHTQQPGAHRRKRAIKFPRFLGTAACVAVGCLLTGLLVSAQARRNTNVQTGLLTARIDALEKEVASFRAGSANTSTPLPAGGVLTPAQVYAKNVNSVVGITCDSSATVSGQTLRRTVTGSGFVISQDGYIVTNFHVVENAKTITVTTQNGTGYEAELIGRDNTADMALIKVDAADLPAVTFGSSQELAIGDMVVAIGNPLSALEATQTVGYISGKNREVTTDSNVVNMLQTDAAINSGNSGGPLFNMRGEVVGVTTAKYSGTTTSGASIEGLSFAIPIDDLKKSIDDLKSQGYVNSAYLGIRGMDVEAVAVDTYGLPKGAYVETVEPDTPAAEAGIHPKDIIIALGSEPVTGFNSLARALRSYQAGDSTTIRVYRSGSTMELPITLSQRPAETEAAAMPQEGSYDDWYEYFNRFGSDNP